MDTIIKKLVNIINQNIFASYKKSFLIPTNNQKVQRLIYIFSIKVYKYSLYIFKLNPLK